MSAYEPHSGEDFPFSLTGPANGPVVILVHGSLDRSSGMARLARVTSRYRQVVRYDRRGYNDRWEHQGPMNVEGNLDDLAHIMGSQPAIVIGHSYGGHIALAAAQHFPEQVVGVSTYESPLSWMTWWPHNTAGALGVSVGPEHGAEEFMIRMIGQQRWDGLPERTKNERRREGVALVSELQSLRQGQPWDLSAIMCPVVCAFGSHAPAHHQRAAHWLQENIRTATLSIIDGAYHGAHMSHPDEFYEQLIAAHVQRTGTLTEIS